MSSQLHKPLLDPGIPDGESTSYRALVSGNEVASGELSVASSDAAYLQQFDVTFEELSRLQLEMSFARNGGTIHADHYRLATSYEDRPVAVEEGWFQDVAGLQFGGTVEPYPASVTPLLGCAIGLRGLDFRKGEQRSVSLWLANTVHWEITAKVEKAEGVSVPAGELDAWRVRVRPSFSAVAKALDRIIGMLLPPFVIHFEEQPPHRLLRFEFPTGPFPWNPRAVIEATALA